MDSSSVNNRKVFIVTKLKELEICKVELFDQLIEINHELKDLHEKGLANAYTIEIVQKEIGSLEGKLVENERAMTFFQDVLRKEYLVEGSFGSLLDLKKAVSDLNYFDCSTTTDATSAVAKDGSSRFKARTEQRLEELEKKVASLFHKESSDVSSEVCINAAKLAAVIKEKEKEIDVLTALNTKYKECNQIINQESNDLQEKLADVSKVAEDTRSKNKELFEELEKSTEALKSTQDAMKSIVEEKTKIESAIISRESKISYQAREIENLKKYSVDTRDIEEKLKLAQEELIGADKEIDYKTMIIEEQERELENAYNGQNLLDGEIQTLHEAQEKMEKENEEVKSRLEELHKSNKILSCEKDALAMKLHHLEGQEEKHQSKISQLEDNTAELEKSKLKQEKELIRYKYDKGVLKDQLKHLEEKHDVCGRNLRELKESNKESIQGMRRQMEQLMNEESGTSRHLEEKLQTQETNFNQEISQLKNQLSTKDDQVVGLRKQLSLVRETHQNELKVKLNSLNEDIESRNKELSLCQDQTDLLKGQIKDFKDIKRNNNKLAKDNEKLKIDNNSMMLDLFQKKEFEKVHKDKIQTLTEKISGLQQELNASKGRVSETAEEKIIKLTKELVTCRFQYNDSIVDCDLMSRKMRESEFDLVTSQEKVEELKKICAELEISVKSSELKRELTGTELDVTKRKLAEQSDAIETLLKERQEDEAKIQMMKIELAKDDLPQKLEGEGKVPNKTLSTLESNQDVNEPKTFLKQSEIFKKDAESLKILIERNVNDDHGTNAESCGKPKEVNLDRTDTKSKILIDNKDDNDKTKSMKASRIGEPKQTVSIDVISGETKIELDSFQRAEEKMEKENEEVKSRLEELHKSNKILSCEKDALAMKLHHLEGQEEKHQSKISQLEDNTAELEKSKLKQEKELIRYKYDKGVLKDQLKHLEEKHDVCGRNLRELKESNKESIQGMRRQMEQLMNEESGTSRHLEEKLQTQETNFNQEISQLKNQLSTRDDQVVGLRKQLSLVRETHQNELKVKLNSLNEDIESRNKELSLCQDQTDLLKGQIKDFKDIKRNNNKLAKDNEKLKIDNNSMMLDLFQKKEFEKVHKDKIQTLIGKISGLQQELNASGRVTETAEEKIIKLTKELVTCRYQYNDSIVDCDLMSRKMRESEFDLVTSQEKVEELKKICAELEISVKSSELKRESTGTELDVTKRKLAEQSDAIETLLKERQEDEAKIQMMKVELAKDVLPQKVEGEGKVPNKTLSTLESNQDVNEPKTFLKQSEIFIKDAESLKILIKGNVNDDHGTNAESCGKPKEVNLDRTDTKSKILIDNKNDNDKTKSMKASRIGEPKQPVSIDVISGETKIELESSGNKATVTPMVTERLSSNKNTPTVPPTKLSDVEVEIEGSQHSDINLSDDESFGTKLIRKPTVMIAFGSKSDGVSDSKVVSSTSNTDNDISDKGNTSQETASSNNSLSSSLNKKTMNKRKKKRARKQKKKKNFNAGNKSKSSTILQPIKQDDGQDCPKNAKKKDRDVEASTDEESHRDAKELTKQIVKICFDMEASEHKLTDIKSQKSSLLGVSPVLPAQNSAKLVKEMDVPRETKGKMDEENINISTLGELDSLEAAQLNK